MKNRVIIFSLMVLVLITCCANVFADGSVDNTTLTTSGEDINSVYPVDVLATSEITITEDTYDDYFNKYTGKLKDDVDVNINTIKIGNVSNKAFTIDRPLNIMPLSSDCEISNGVIHLIAGSSGSNITNLVINNTKGDVYQDGLFVSKLHGIWFSNSSDNLIFNNTIRIAGAEGCYAIPMGYSSRNKILYNDIVSTFTSCILLGLCDYNNISYNRFVVKTLYYAAVSNIIYFNPYGHADYSGPADSVGNYISNNYLKNVDENSIMEYTINIMGNSSYTKLINNTVINGFFGITVGSNSKNVTISGNTIINCTSSISAGSNEVIISNNMITGSSMSGGITISEFGDHIDKAYVFDNKIIYENLNQGIGLLRGANVYNNTIILSRYGAGIVVSGASNSNITDNYIYVVEDDGVSIQWADNTLVSNNIIHTKANGISIWPKIERHKVYNTTITYNNIYCDKYGVHIEGYAYNTTINDNYIETNESEAFYIDMYVTINDNNPGRIADNTINGVIRDTEILIINDTNFYDYFDDEGYLKHGFKDNSHKILFLTFLTNKDLHFTDSIILTSNKQDNLLYNVSISLEGDASDSIITGLKFYNIDKESLILNGVENVAVRENEFTTLTGNVFEIKVISVIGGCNLCNITDNSIFINSNANYTYAISVSEPLTAIKKRFSTKFSISNNNILIKSRGVGEAMYFDALVESDISKNNINIISDGSAYGIAVCDVMGRPYDISIESNKIIVNSKEMSYLIELYRTDDSKITNNYLKGTSNGVYAIGLYNSSAPINGNEIIVVGNPLTDNPPFDALGKGNSAVYLARQSQIRQFKNNVIDSQNCEIITNTDSDIKIMSNAFVVSNYNYDLYFKSNGKLYGDIIKNGDMILFKNFTDSKVMDINVSVTVNPYYYLNDFKASLILSNGSDKSMISGFNFNNADIILNNVSNILITLNNFTDSKVKDDYGFNNTISNNTFAFKLNNSQSVILNNCLNDTFMCNKVVMNSSNSKFIVIEKSNGTDVVNNSFDGSGKSIKLVYSNLSDSSDVLYNSVNVNASGEFYFYFAHNETNCEILNNQITVNALSGNPIAIYYNNSFDNKIKFNNIYSSSKEGHDYAIVIDSQNNTVTNNYLISSNGFRRGDDAVNALNNTVCDNVPVDVYVSLNGSENGYGSFENPYPTIKNAIENALGGAIIHILPGMYNESDIVIDKNITLTAINLEGNTYINALGSQLFKIKKGGTLSVNGLKIFNGFSVDGGSLFNNLGTLMINNSVIYNSSSYYDNSNPEFKFKNKYNKYTMYSYDCSNLGLGGAILNRGDLIIISSTLYDNFAHKGGAIADYGKTTIKNSLICNNTGVHGGAIYTNSSREFVIENSHFIDNLAIQTLDYCFIKKIIYEEYPNLAGLRYRYVTNCDVLTGMGGAIFSNTVLNINNSLFDHNIGKYGGAIAYDSNLLYYNYYSTSDLYYQSSGDKIVYSPTSILKIENSLFKDNEAKSTFYGNLSMLADDRYGGSVYSTHAEGGAIFGALKEFGVYNSTFVHNIAESNGGALCVQSLESSIEACKFNENLAGERGGALDLFGNFEVFNTEIMNNSAKYGGAIQYHSYSLYERVQNNVDMFNITVAGNRALKSGGAFFTGLGNIAIKNSNIYDNTAPIGSTFSSAANIDARGNWWGSINGPDDSVFLVNKIRYRTWAGQKIDWGPVVVKSGDDSNNNGNNANGKSQTESSISTGSSVHTGSTLTVDTSSHMGGTTGIKFNGNWPNGNNNGNNGANFYDGNGVTPYESSGNSRTSVDGNAVNPNSLSKTNSSNVNDLASVGMSANAADSSASSESSSSQGASEDSSKAYEIKKDVEKEIDDDLSIFNILFVLLWIFLFIGFYKKYKKTDER